MPWLLRQSENVRCRVSGSEMGDWSQLRSCDYQCSIHHALHARQGGLFWQGLLLPVHCLIRNFNVVAADCHNPSPANQHLT